MRIGGGGGGLTIGLTVHLAGDPISDLGIQIEREQHEALLAPRLGSPGDR